MPAQFRNQARDASAALLAFFVRSGWLGVEFGAQVAVTKTVDGEFARQDGGEQAAIIVSKRVETGEAFAILGMAPAQVIQVRDGFAFEFRLRQVFEVTVIGLLADFGIAIQIGNAFAHGHPPQLAIFRLATDFELARIVNGRFHS